MASVTYYRFDGQSVSAPWFAFLTFARAAGVRFVLDSGHRTEPEQWGLYNNQPPLAAYPSPTAPHIRTGRWDHAVDIDASDGGAERVRRFAAKHGVTLAYAVAGEPWHLETQTDFRGRFTMAASVLQHGSRGKAVLFYGRRLRTVGWLSTPNLFFTSGAVSATKGFQKVAGLPQSGKADDKTQAALGAAVRAHLLGHRPRAAGPKWTKAKWGFGSKAGRH